jgi:hypothetical protein
MKRRSLNVQQASKAGKTTIKQAKEKLLYE